jgi:hypothetical protein
MATERVMKVVDIVGDALCVASEDGQKVFDAIEPLMSAGTFVRLSFAGVKSLTTAFLNSAIGQLYSKFTEDQIRGHFGVADMEQDDVGLLKIVINRAKQYFKDPKPFEKARKADEAKG